MGDFPLRLRNESRNRIRVGFGPFMFTGEAVFLFYDEGGFTKIVRFSKKSDLLDISNFTGDPLFGLIL